MYVILLNESICVLGTFSSTNSGFTMSSGFVTESKFSQISGDIKYKIVPSNHIEFDFNVTETSTTVYTNDSSNHFRYNDSVSLMSLNGLGFFSRKNISFRCSNLFDIGDGCIPS